MQTTVVKLNVIVGSYEYAAAGTVSFVLEVLQVYVITFFFASAVTYVLEVAEIFGLNHTQLQGSTGMTTYLICKMIHCRGKQNT